MEFVELEGDTAQVAEENVVWALGVEFEYFGEGVIHEVDVLKVAPRHLLAVLEVADIHSADAPHVHGGGAFLQVLGQGHVAPQRYLQVLITGRPQLQQHFNPLLDDYRIGSSQSDGPGHALHHDVLYLIRRLLQQLQQTLQIQCQHQTVAHFLRLILQQHLGIMIKYLVEFVGHSE